MSKPARISKYRNVQTAVRGKVFGSKREAKRYGELKMLEDVGLIWDLKTQAVYELIPKQDGERACSYIADFVYESSDGTHVEDTKGFRTKDYVIKRKLMLWIHKIEIEEI